LRCQSDPQRHNLTWFDNPRLRQHRSNTCLPGKEINRARHRKFIKVVDFCAICHTFGDLASPVDKGLRRGRFRLA
jgi:hypothetical protein